MKQFVKNVWYWLKRGYSLRTAWRMAGRTL